MVTRIEIDDSSGRVTGVRYVHNGTERVQRADAVAVAGYSIETPRLLLNSVSRRFAHGLANNNDQVGRCVMVQGAPQVAGRFPDELRMYKMPPPEISSEQFYETDPHRGFARGFSIQTVGPLPIEWAQHVLADGHWGQALREYMRDYNHWYTLGVLSELQPLPENRVTVSEVTDQNGIPVARMDYTQCENDRKNIAFAEQTLHDIFEAAGAQDVLAIDRYAHLVGGCRMGSDPDLSVVDSDHRAWEVPNLFIADGSVMPTQGAANPLAARRAPGPRAARRSLSQSATFFTSATNCSIARSRSSSSARRIADGCVVIITKTARSDPIGPPRSRPIRTREPSSACVAVAPRHTSARGCTTASSARSHGKHALICQRSGF